MEFECGQPCGIGLKCRSRAKLPVTQTLTPIYIAVCGQLIYLSWLRCSRNWIFYAVGSQCVAAAGCSVHSFNALTTTWKPIFGTKLLGIKIGKGFCVFFHGSRSGARVRLGAFQKLAGRVGSDQEGVGKSHGSGWVGSGRGYQASRVRSGDPGPTRPGPTRPGPTRPDPTRE